ncbi:MAG: 2-phospho-L-lactate transferase CofD family protein [Desulfotalea sp.]
MPDSQTNKFSALDFLDYTNFEEKLVGLIADGIPTFLPHPIADDLEKIKSSIDSKIVNNKKVVVFGGGSGLANIIGGSCKTQNWTKSPFVGIKERFTNTSSIICITDDGGATGELLKHFPLIALGDIRHVLLSSIQKNILSSRYKLDSADSLSFVDIIATLFNYRGIITKDLLLNFNFWKISILPSDVFHYFSLLLKIIATDHRFSEILGEKSCLGNLLVISAIYDHTKDGESDGQIHLAIKKGLDELAINIGANKEAVLPCTSTPARLRAIYSNGVESIGEYRIGTTAREFPVTSLHVDFSAPPKVHDEVFDLIKDADLIVFAPGSLYSSILPILKVQPIIKAIRGNRKAIKLLIANLWVQKGETDLSNIDPERKFFVSDLIKAYEENIEGGTSGIFNKVLCMKMGEIPASIIQNYALEDKVPIFLDRKIVEKMSYGLIESALYSKYLLHDENVIQHAPDKVAITIEAILKVSLFKDVHRDDKGKIPDHNYMKESVVKLSPYHRFKKITDILENKKEICNSVTWFKDFLIDLIWSHKVIPCCHLTCFAGFVCIEKEHWPRCDSWDNVLAFFDPKDKNIKFRDDLLRDKKKLELSLLIAIGESLLGDYAKSKEMHKVKNDSGQTLGQVFHLYTNAVGNHRATCYLSNKELKQWLKLSKMHCIEENHYTRLINGAEKFTPPALHLGLVYVWYLDNRLASHIEHKMNVLRLTRSQLLPALKENVLKRQEIIKFFREYIFNFKVT